MTPQLVAHEQDVHAHRLPAGVVGEPAAAGFAVGSLAFVLAGGSLVGLSTSGENTEPTS